jgi:hypothetical protein
MAETTHLFNNAINTTKAYSSWEGPGQLSAARYSKDRKLSRRYLVNPLLMHGHVKHAEKERLSLRILCTCSRARAWKIK